MVRTDGARKKVDIEYVEGRTIYYGCDGLQFKVAVVDIIGRERGLLYGVMDEEG